jgi:hypothetical protein
MELTTKNLNQMQRMVKGQKIKNNIEKSFQDNRYSHLMGEIVIATTARIIYGDEACIKHLNEANILTKLNQPLIEATIHIKEEKEIGWITTTDLTKRMPTTLKNEIKAHAIELQSQIAENIHKASNLFVARKAIEEQSTKNLMMPPVIPVHFLDGRSTVTFKLYKRYLITCIINQQEKLTKTLNSSSNAIFTITTLDPKALNTVKEIVNTGQIFPRLNALTPIMIRNIYNPRIAESVDNLEEKKIIKQNNLNNVEPYEKTKRIDRYVISTVSTKQHGSNGYSPETLKNDVLSCVIKNQSIFTFITKRSINGHTRF